MAFAEWCALISLLVNFVLMVIILQHANYISFQKELTHNEEYHEWITSVRQRINASRKRREVSENEKFEMPCFKLQRRHLINLLGPAYNPRYMSVDRPEDFYANETMEEEKLDPLPMHVRENYVREMIEYQKVVDQFRLGTTATPWAQSPGQRSPRTKRFLPRNVILDVKNGKTPWTCPWHIHWVDMGSDTFPRFMRSVTCSSATCWFGRLTCKPRAFVVVILRRKRTRCWADEEQIDQLFPMREVRGESKLPPELREEWVFEERSANFCCECVLEAPEGTS